MKINTILAIIFISACTLVQKPIQFSVSPQIQDPIGVVSRILAAEGQSVTETDMAHGIVQTAWSDTGLNFGAIYVNDVRYNATIHRRFTATVNRKTRTTEVTLRVDTQKCAMIPESGQTCQEMEGFATQPQEELNQLGAKLRKAMQSH